MVFDKIAFVKFKTSNNLKQNIDETHLKQPKIHRLNPYQPMDFENQIRKPKVSRLCQMFVIVKS